VWGWTFSVVKEAVDGYGVLAFLTIRFSLAIALLAPIALRRTTRATWRAGFLVGLSLAGGYLLQTYGVRYTSASNNGLITGLFVVFAPLCNWALFRVRTTPVFWLTVSLSVLGLSLLTGGVSGFAFGDALTLGCSVCFGLQIALLDRHSPEHSAVGLAFTQLTVATVIFAVAWPFAEPFVLPPPDVWQAIVLLAVFATAGGFLLQTLCQRDLPAVRAAVLLSMEPVFAALFGYLVAGDRLSHRQLLGAAVMVAAVVLAEVLPAAKRAQLRRQTS
jgi:drug/metabolite transporter (DMT)-like permease